MQRPSGEIQTGWYPSVAKVAEAIGPILTATRPGTVPLVPSTLSRSNAVIGHLRSALRRHDVRTTVLLPRAMAAAVFGGRGNATWHRIDTGEHRFMIDARLNAPYVTITIVDGTMKSGPFVLDLPSRFLHPADRVRLAAKRDRLRLLADIASHGLPSACIVVTPVSNGWLSLATRDAIAAELWSLAFAERYLDQRLEMQGPWEDVTIQRATELDLGVRIPREMDVTVASATPIPPEARELLRQSAWRLGLDLPA